MTIPCTFTLDLEVYDPEALFEAAVKRGVEENLHEDQVRRDLRDNSGEVEIDACLVMLLDPGSLDGCSIEDSGADVHYHLANEGDL